MTKISYLPLLLMLLLTFSCQQKKISTEHALSAPNGEISVQFLLDETGTPMYLVSYDNETLIDSSSMGFKFKGFLDLKNGFSIENSEFSSFQETWEQPWGEQRMIENHYNEMIVNLKERDIPGRALQIIFRAFDDGIAFRYHFPKYEGVDSLTIMDELTEFQFTEDLTCWWTPGDWDIYEHIYHTSKVSEINALDYASDQGVAQTYIPENSVNTPLTLRTEKGVHLSIHEANLTDYAGMTLKVDTNSPGFQTSLVGSKRLGHKVKRALPFSTPWRTIQISPDAPGLIESYMILNLNEPNKLGDVSWVKPLKYVGIWWEYHLTISAWDMASGKHGATTENAKAHIDFAAANNLGAVLVEGWNTGWEPDQSFDFVTPYPDYDLKFLAAYAKKKGVEIIMHHETFADVESYEEQMDTAFRLMEDLGIHAVKTGYVHSIKTEGEYHHGQWMVNHYRKVFEEAAKYKIAVNVHEPIMATGIRRTYPNAISREGVRGQEFNIYSKEGGNRPEHLPIVAFTRMLAGPIDFTPGVFEFKLKPYRPNNQVQTTLAQQLALYVVIYSPIQMACDLLKNYENQPAFQFIRDVGVDWEQTKVLGGEVGNFVTIAREERNTGNWFVGSISDENSRKIEINFDFLPEGQTFKAIIYQDGENAHWNDNPTAIDIQKMDITNNSKLEIPLAPGGGVAISLIKE